MADQTRKTKSGLKEICVREEFKIAAKLAVDKFRQDGDKKELEFPSSFTSKERAYIHRLSQNLGLNSKSRGSGNNRFLVVSKKTASSLTSSSPIKLSPDAIHSIGSLLQKFPLNSKERQELLPKVERSTFLQNESGRGSRENKFVGKLSCNTPMVPSTVHNKDLATFRMSLPIAEMKEEILNAIEKNQVVLLSGETGSGKTTQVPQYILENSAANSVPCRVVCTQPRRISAISVAERVSTERGERLGSTVGYQIRLDSRVSPKTLLTYCTNGVLLRTLMAGDSNLSSVTHVIVDEIHERDRFSDFLLISLRDLLIINRKLKLILMSAALDIDLFVQYFGKCPVLHVPGRCFEVKPYFLEDVLKMTSYTNKEMAKHMKEADTANKKMEDLKITMDKEVCEREKAEKSKRMMENKYAEQSAAEEEVIVLEEPDNGEEVEVEDILEIETVEDPEQKLAEDSQEKEFVTQFSLEEDASLDGEVDVEVDTEDIGDDVLLEEEEELEDESEEVLDEALDDDDDVDVEVEEQFNTKDDLDEVPKIKILLKSGDTVGVQATEKEENADEIEYLKQEMDNSISEAWLKGDEESFVQILHLIMNENIPVDYQHTETQATALMVAAGRGCVEIVEQLLNMDANPHIREPKNGWAALDWAKKWEHSEVIELLESYMTCSAVPYCDEITLEKESKEISGETKELLSLYHKTFDDERVDLELIMCLIKYICSTYGPGSILVFLPGYDEIITLKEWLVSEKEFGNTRRYQLFTLHSSMQPSEQRKMKTIVIYELRIGITKEEFRTSVFRRIPSTIRKIILSTNIAETSVTIDDVVYVIDSGKVKEKSFDALSSMSTLHSVWISKSSALQRRGRAGRCSPGVCFHLFSRVRHDSLQEYQLPELLRVPLQELCLHTKLLAGTNTPIADFLAKAPEAPSFLMLRNAVMLLKTIDALDRWEDLTDLGRHVADLPLEPRLAKMILYGVVLKCLDPVVTVACALAYRDPFVLPMNSSEKRDAMIARKKFAVDPFSDHLTFVKAFRGWQRARSDGFDKNFCRRNYLSPATLEMMAGMRSQILGHLKGVGFVRQRGGGDIRDLNSNSNNWAVVKAAICAGMYPQIARVDRDARRITTQKEDKIRIHNWSFLRKPPQKGESLAQANASVIRKLPSDWIVYEEMSRMYTSVTIKCCTLLSAACVALTAGPSLSSENVESGTGSRDTCHAERRFPDTYNNVSSDSDEDGNREGTGNNEAGIKIDDWISLTGTSEAVNLVTFLRHKFQALFIRRIRNPGRPWTQVDEAVVRAVVSVLTAEESVINPTLVQARQRRTRSGPESSHDVRPRIESRPRTYQEQGERYRVYRERERYPSGSYSSRPDSLQLEPSKKASDNPTTRFPSDHEKSYEARYFIIKCNNQRNLEISLAKGIWATTLANEKKLNRAFKESKQVFLIFSVQGSGHFQGYARMVSAIGREKSPEFGSSALGGVFSVDWIKKASIPFQQAHHLVNPWNDNKKVQISRDGQEVEPKVGEELCKLWEQDPVNIGNTSRYQPRPGVSRGGRAKPPGQNMAVSPQPGIATHSHWQSSPPAVPGSAVYQVYASHTASMPIPVPVPSPHTGHPAVQQTFSRPYQGATRPQATVAFAAQQPQIRGQSQRYPVTQPGLMQVRGMGSTSPHSSRPSMQTYASPRK